MELDDFKPDLAMRITSQTLVGVDMSKYPVEHGNCFSIMTEKVYRAIVKIPEKDRKNLYFDEMRKDWRIVNFYAENLKKLIEDEMITWPVKILVREGRIGRCRIALIHDERIPDEWYASHWCETCCPEALLPINQRLNLERQTLRGDREVIKTANGMTMIRCRIQAKPRKLKANWKVDFGEPVMCVPNPEVERALTEALMDDLKKSSKKIK